MGWKLYPFLDWKYIIFYFYSFSRHSYKKATSYFMNVWLVHTSVHLAVLYCFATAVFRALHWSQISPAKPTYYICFFPLSVFLICCIYLLYWLDYLHSFDIEFYQQIFSGYSIIKVSWCIVDADKYGKLAFYLLRYSCVSLCL